MIISRLSTDCLSLQKLENIIFSQIMQEILYVNKFHSSLCNKWRKNQECDHHCLFVGVLHVLSVQKKKASCVIANAQDDSNQREFHKKRYQQHNTQLKHWSTKYIKQQNSSPFSDAGNTVILLFAFCASYKHFLIIAMALMTIT